MKFTALLALLALLASPAAAGRGLRGLETAQPANTAVEERGLIDQAVEYVETIGEVFDDAVAGVFGGSVCLYGLNCGMNCVHDGFIEGDALDEACYDHDVCLRDAGDDTEAKCKCDEKLISTSGEIASWDEDSDMVRTAATVRDGIILFGKTMHGCYF